MEPRIGDVVLLWQGRHDRQGARSPRAAIVVACHSDKHCAVVCWDGHGVQTYHNNVPYVLAQDLISPQLPEGPFVEPSRR